MNKKTETKWERWLKNFFTALIIVVAGLITVSVMT